MLWTYHGDYTTMAKKKQNITITGRQANRRVQSAIPKLQRQLGYGKRQATAVAIRMDSVGQLGMGGRPYMHAQQVGLVVVKGSGGTVGEAIRSYIEGRHEVMGRDGLCGGGGTH